MESKQSKGGNARREALSPERRSEIARAAALRRWSDKESKIVYVIGPDVGPVKVGISKSATRRLNGLQNSNHLRLKVYFTHTPEAGMPALKIEWVAHKILAANRLAGEWFDVTPEEAIEAIKDAVALLKEPVEAPPPKVRVVKMKPEKVQFMTAEEFVDAVSQTGVSLDKIALWLRVSYKTITRYTKTGPSNPAARCVSMSLETEAFCNRVEQAAREGRIVLTEKQQQCIDELKAMLPKNMTDEEWVSLALDWRE